jgi:hypothetical protein
VVGGLDLTDNNTVGFAAGKDGNAASFASANSEYLSGTGIDTSGNYHLAFWYQRKAIGTYIVWLNRNGHTYVLDISGVMQFNQQKDSSSATTLGHETVVLQDVWYLFEVEMSSGSMNFWINGVAAIGNGQALGGAQTASDGALGFNLGGYSGGLYSTSLIDAPLFWPRVLTAQERTDLYDGGAGLFY